MYNSKKAHLLLFLCLFLIVSQEGFSQFKVLPMVGFTNSMVTESPAIRLTEYKYPSDFNKKDFSLGVSIQKYLSEKWLVKSEFQFVQLGTKTEGDIIGSDYELLAIELQYLNTGIKLSRTFWKTIFLDFGIYNSLLLKHYNDANGFGGFTRNRSSGVFSKTDFGLVGGAGIEKWNINLGVNYFHGIKKIREQDQNRFFQIFLGYFFQI